MHIGPFEIRTTPLAGAPHTVHSIMQGGVVLGSQLSPPVLHECLAHASHACDRGTITRAALARIRQLAALTDPAINAPVVRLPRQDKIADDRHCTKCKKPESESPFRILANGRKQSWCLACERKYARDYQRRKNARTSR